MDPIKTPPALLPPNVDGIPAEMMATPRWAPWRAVWNPKGNGGAGKYEKIPHRADRPSAGLSNKTAAGWTTFHQALAAYKQHPDKFAGVGYLMTGPHGVVGIDLDHCRDPQTGEVAPWAAEVAAKLDSYTEVSPSGTGLHVITSGEVSEDWANHEQGVEVYAGNVARFLVITGQRLPGAPAAIRPLRTPVLDQMAARWRKKLTAAEVHDLHLPELIPECMLPAVEDLDLPTYARNFLLDGPGPGDRSRQLIATAIALAQAGITREEVLSILEQNDHAMEVALDHRRQDYDKALRFLWQHSAQAGAARAQEIRQLQMDEFDDMGAALDILAIPRTDEQATPPADQVIDIADDFEDLGPDDQQQVDAPAKSLAPVKVPRFTPQRLGTFLQRRRAEWTIKGVLPRTGLAVVYGASGSGKTFLMLDMAGAVARGADWRGRPVAQGRVVYIVAEGADGFRNRVEAYCRQQDIEPDTVELLVIPDTPNFLDKVHIKELVAAIKTVGQVALIVVDTYARVMVGGNENDSKDTGQAVAHCDLLHKIFKALVVLVHHSGKDATKGARGSGALRAAADVEMEVVRTREYRAATITKMKDGEDGAELGFNLGIVTIGQDDDGEDITSCVVEHRENLPAKHERKEEPKGEIEKLVYRYVATVADLDTDGITRDDIISTTSEQLDPPAAGEKDRRKEAIKRALTTLVRKNLLADDGFTVSLVP
jgi:RecA-family ATPase